MFNEKESMTLNNSKLYLGMNEEFVKQRILGVVLHFLSQIFRLFQERIDGTAPA